jgi:hypothetical protein
MKLTKNSKDLIDFYVKNKCLQNIDENNKTTNAIFKKFFDELQNAEEQLELKKKNYGAHFFSLSITKISTVKDVPKPSQFNAKSFPEQVRKSIDEESAYDLCYNFSLLNREITIHFITEDPNAEFHVERYNKYVEKIFLWLHFIDSYASRGCARKLTLYFYFTSLKKVLPENHIHVLDEKHVNTGFTYTCPVVSEIVIFREEEWFKVFMHETFHNFGLDFSDMNTSDCHKKILSIFPVESDVNLYEAYTEFWALTLNAVFCSYFMRNRNSENQYHNYLQDCYILLSFEKTHSFFQLVKTLEFMGLTYKSLYLPSFSVERSNLYKENSNVLAYYVIKTILLNNFNGTLGWSKKNNLSLLQFKKTTGNLDEFCKFIEKNYKTKSMLQGVECMETVYFDSMTNFKQSKKMNFIWNNMRMSMCEMG